MGLVVIVVHSASLSKGGNTKRALGLWYSLLDVYLLEVANDLSLVFWIFVRRTCHVPVAECWWRCRTRRFDQLVIVVVNRIVVEFLFVLIFTAGIIVARTSGFFAAILNAFQFINSLLFPYKKPLFSFSLFKTSSASARAIYFHLRKARNLGD